ncbi:phage baseplate plug family protein [Sporosarcina sp. FSL W7-1283]|uniref:phage baseplate plug family protein n=1 Tax=Sporosarcina sp. FSL W7-1283 TaxID=2921560 RepID=UPI0030FCAB83
MNYIEIDKEAIPYSFEMQLDNVTWGFEVRYNAEHDFFTVDLLRLDDLIVAGEKLVYGKPLFENVQTKPLTPIIPFDESGNAKRIGWEELEESVFLYMMDGELDE